MDPRTRPAGSGVRPGTEAAGLGFVTAAVLAGLIVTGLAVAAHDGQLGGVRTASRLVSQAPAGASGVPATAQGTALFKEAAVACQQVAFQGVEVQQWWSPLGASTSVLDLWHAPGGRTIARPVPAVPGGPGTAHRLLPAGDGSGSQGMWSDGMLGMSPRLVALLTANYRLAVTGRGQVAGRPARVVTARRPGGSLAARVWLDGATGLPLRRQLYDVSGREFSDVAFTQLKVGPTAVTQMPGAAARPWDDTLTLAQMALLRTQGWLLPGPMPGGLSLVSASESTTRAGPVVDLDYSDGLFLVSVFVERGHLPSGLRGWSRVALRGRRVYADPPDFHSVAWSARGFVYTVVAAAPQQTLSRVVAALPHDASPGFLARIGHGLRELLSWLTP